MLRALVYFCVGVRATCARVHVFVCILPFLGACSTLPDIVFGINDIPPLKLDGRVHEPEEAITGVYSPDVLHVSDEMRDFVERFTADSNNSRNKLMSLHWAIKSPGGLAMHYDPFADGDARSTFNRGSANCLSYAHMFIALAREAGLNARYQWMEVRPEWHRLGERVAVRLHVNVQVKMRDTTEYMIDIDPLSRSQVAGSRIMSDAEGLALHHNNLAMLALADERIEEAWMHLVRGVDAAPGLSQLWVNLGAIYRQVGQYREAEQTYFRALEINDGDRSAMNNLVVLYELEAREEERAYWLDRMHRYRLNNPYYHANLGDIAMQSEDWDEAYEHYSQARKLHPEDGQLIYSLGLAEYRRGRPKAAHKLITEAIEHASFQVEKERYRIELRSIEKQQQAASL